VQHATFAAVRYHQHAVLASIWPHRKTRNVNVHRF